MSFVKKNQVSWAYAMQPWVPGGPRPFCCLIDVLVLNQGAFVRAPAVAVTAPAVVVLVKRILGGGLNPF
jgi:hypothetical protein